MATIHSLSAWTTDLTNWLVGMVVEVLLKASTLIGERRS